MGKIYKFLGNFTQKKKFLVNIIEEMNIYEVYENLSKKKIEKIWNFLNEKLIFILIFIFLEIFLLFFLKYFLPGFLSIFALYFVLFFKEKREVYYIEKKFKFYKIEGIFKTNINVFLKFLKIKGISHK